MSKRNTILFLTAAAGLLSACGVGSTPGLESANQPVVSRTDYVFDAATDGSYLAAGEQARVAGWLASLRLGYGDRLYVDDPAGTGATRQVATEAARYGVLLSGPAPVTTGAVQPGMVRVIVSRMKASVPGCPDRRDTGEGNFGGKTSSGYGCAINGNLAAMVARPEDLVRGEPGSPTADPAQISKSIKALREAAPTGTGGTTVKAEGTGGGTQ
jgi:pilus assembly protein CpaD